MQKGTGKVSIYSGPAATWPTATGTLSEEIDVVSLPLIAAVQANNKMGSGTLVRTSSPLAYGSVYKLIVPSTAFKDLAGNPFTAFSSSVNNAQSQSNFGVLKTFGSEILVERHFLIEECLFHLNTSLNRSMPFRLNIFFAQCMHFVFDRRQCSKGIF